MVFIGFPGGLYMELEPGPPGGLYTKNREPWLPTPREYLDITVPVISRLFRFTGHCPGLTVAAHSLLVADLARVEGWPKAAQAALATHDLHEAFMGDIASPTQRLVRNHTGVLDELSTRLEQHKHRALGVCPDPALLARLDYRAAELEARWFGIDFQYAIAPPTPEELVALNLVMPYIRVPNAEQVIAETLYAYILGG